MIRSQELGPASDTLTPRNGQLKIQWDTVDAEDVARQFVKGYDKDDSKGVIENHEWFYDAKKGKFIFKLFVRVPAP